MRPALRATAALAVGAVLTGLLAGCSGPGAAPEPADLAQLHAIADDQLSALLLVKRWLTVLYQPPPEEGGSTAARACEPGCQPVSSLPSDPPGSSRYACVLEDCTTLDDLALPDGSSVQVFHYTDGREATWTWSPWHMDSGWLVTTAQALLWDGTQLDWESAGLPRSPGNQQRKSGKATLADGRTMTFVLNRRDDLDQLELRPADGSRLALEVPLRYAQWTLYWPIFNQRAAGTYEGPTGQRLTFSLIGASNNRWEQWTLSAADGTTGLFVLDESLGGTGELRRGEHLLGTLDWRPSGKGTLRPVQAGVVHAAPSAAARDFQIDQWIRNIASTGPMPR